MKNYKHPMFSDDENNLLTPWQWKKLAKHDDAQKDSYRRWKQRVARRLRDGEIVEDFDTVDYMNLPEGVRLIHATNIGGEPEYDDYDEESGPE